MKLKISNKEEIDNFIRKALEEGAVVFSVKGNPPQGATYDDGTLITGKINRRWVNDLTNKYTDIKYLGD